MVCCHQEENLMRYKTLITLSLLCFFPAWGVSPVQADFVEIDLIDVDGDDSGWTVTSDGVTALDLLPSNIIDVDLASDVKTVTITIEKDYGPYAHNPILDRIDFPVAILTFNKAGANADSIDKIIILSETVDNHTGVAWDCFSWKLAPGGAAKFNTDESSGWSEAAFADWSFETDRHLLASNGSVANDDTFSPSGGIFPPSGGLVIDILLGDSETGGFTLKQSVSPEPATLILLGAGLPLLLKRKR